ncbi:hypothetical protein DFP94_103449 [Fontibacillus phaseoli]|uniref:FR47-like protein n=1 Tax=Fontibacillus phaseoli TaxID=1416533 RepID=A0A369BJG7_9BACL|nr:hypothetical protein [Fontibacillus phaseoli]RCX20716.1 hypothetical protein DFP94_103449 [Fontibacillus phaseoli]
MGICKYPHSLLLVRSSLPRLIGKTIATLGTHGTNRKAISLYTQLGYELYGFRLPIGYEIE